jgi:hypothetical protein
MTGCSIDLPHPRTAKRTVWYAGCLKIYGLIPWILTRRLQETIVDDTGGISEPCYTLVAYQQPAPAVDALLSWLTADAGFVWTVTRGFFQPHEHVLSQGVIMRYMSEPNMPQKWYQASEQQIDVFGRILRGEVTAHDAFSQMTRTDTIVPADRKLSS